MAEAGAGQSNEDEPSCRPSVEADTVLDDDVVEYTTTPEQHLPDDVKEREMFRVDRGGAARAGGQEERVVLLGDHELHRELAGRWIERRCSGRFAGRVELAPATAPRSPSPHAP